MLWVRCTVVCIFVEIKGIKSVCRFCGVNAAAVQSCRMCVKLYDDNDNDDDGNHSRLSHSIILLFQMVDEMYNINRQILRTGFYLIERTKNIYRKCSSFNLK